MSPLRGTVSLRLATSLTSSIQLSGFLTILEQDIGGRHAWQRRWCHLSDLRMHFWNYPSDQDEKVPKVNLQIFLFPVVTVSNINNFFFLFTSDSLGCN